MNGRAVPLWFIARRSNADGTKPLYWSLVENTNRKPMCFHRAIEAHAAMRGSPYFYVLIQVTLTLPPEGSAIPDQKVEGGTDVG